MLLTEGCLHEVSWGMNKESRDFLLLLMGSKRKLQGEDIQLEPARELQGDYR